jgi:hypothetical protein
MEFRRLGRDQPPCSCLVAPRRIDRPKTVASEGYGRKVQRSKPVRGLAKLVRILFVVSGDRVGLNVRLRGAGKDRQGLK